MFHIGIIGGGGISDTHARAAIEVDNAEVSAFVGANKDKVELLSQKYGGAAYVDFDSFLNHKPLDAVMIGSPSGLHAQQGIECARRGMHVLVEKPIDVTVNKADALIAECDRMNVKLGVCFQDRGSGDFIRLKGLIESGNLGKVILVSGRVKWYRPPEYYSGSRWRGKLDLDGGGALMNQGVHTVDLLLWLLGDVERVYARSLTALHEIESEDTLVATLEFANGALGTLEAATSVFPGYDRRVEITGSEGTIIVERDRIVRADLKTPLPNGLDPSEQDTNPSSTSPIVSDVSGHKRILEDFLKAIATNTTPRCDGREGRRSVKLVQAIYESAGTGRVVDVSR
ncbi:MAG TPA: Gfo/Idh/MocA family oxidoreductase [Pyrinomonadaceae bacterium]|jgi:predicted dehydrogenase|nr:Gfo/Idh/MocA family oxidoreductase [Pyrinomonadaceae bacterium]